MLSMAMLWAHSGKPAEAEPLFVKALEVGRRVLGEEHPTTLRGYPGSPGPTAGTCYC
jgi:hypothetical protein